MDTSNMKMIKLFFAFKILIINNLHNLNLSISTAFIKNKNFAFFKKKLKIKTKTKFYLTL